MLPPQPVPIDSSRLVDHVTLRGLRLLGALGLVHDLRPLPAWVLTPAVR